METTISFGYWIRRQRKALDLTQQTLADRVGCSLAAIKKIEADERRPSRQIAERIAEALDVPTGQRENFLEVARGLRSPERLLPFAHEAVISPHQAVSSLPSGTVTFLFTDIEGSTLLSQIQPEAMKHGLARHHAILRAAIESNGGHVFQIVGDSVSAAFDDALLALKAALDAQRRLHAEPWGESKPIHVRIGLHTGVVNITEGSLEMPYTGYLTIAIAQRIMSVASGDQILLSGVTRELLDGRLPGDMTLRDMGENHLKDLLQPIHLYQVTTADLPADFPPLKTLDSFPNNLPIQLTSFIGREHELVEVKQVLANTRLLMLTGPGGTGKTRLALQAAGQLLPSFVDGVWLAELAPVSDASLIPQTIAGNLGLHPLPNLPILDILTDYLRAKQLLLILDNCEHLVDACAKLSDHLLRTCPQLKIVATSREGLGIAGEITYRVPSLSLPDQPQVTREAALGYEAVQLFVERAGAANPSFRLTDENASYVAQICRRLDGIPLALELAAARMRLFSTEEIAARLDDRFSLLTGGSRTALERHQTLRALIDWSYDLLSDDERSLFRHLSVFAGGWTFEAAEAVYPDLDVLNLLTQLVDKSLVMVDADAHEPSTRYHLLETIRQYASEKLLDADESHPAGARHANFFLNFAETAEHHLHGPQDMQWLSRLEIEYDNLRAALDWGMKNDVTIALRLGTALYMFWNTQCYQGEGCLLLSEALERLKKLPPVEGAAANQRIALQARALNDLGRLGFGVGDTAGSIRKFEESLTLSRQIGEKSTLTQALTTLGYAKAISGDTRGSLLAAEEALALAREIGDKALLGQALRNMAYAMLASHADPQVVRAYSEESLQLYKEAGAHWDLAMALFQSGLLATWQGNDREARSRFEACLQLFHELKDRNHFNGIRSQLAHLERRQGHFAEAKSLYHETLLEWQRLGQRAAMAHELECLAMVAKAQQEHQRAARLFAAAEALREKIAIPMTATERVEYEREVNDLRATMDQDLFARAWAEGRAMSMEQALDLAFT